MIDALIIVALLGYAEVRSSATARYAASTVLTWLVGLGVWLEVID